MKRLSVGWTVPIETQRAVKTVLVDIAKKSDRNAIAAGRVLVSLRKLDIQQQKLDLRREKQDGQRSEIRLADLVGEADQRAEERKAEREASAPPVKAKPRRRASKPKR
jgi:hypothetical protein